MPVKAPLPDWSGGIIPGFSQNFGKNSTEVRVTACLRQGSDERSGKKTARDAASHTAAAYIPMGAQKILQKTFSCARFMRKGIPAEFKAEHERLKEVDSPRR